MSKINEANYANMPIVIPSGDNMISDEGNPSRSEVLVNNLMPPPPAPATITSESSTGVIDSIMPVDHGIKNKRGRRSKKNAGDKQSKVDGGGQRESSQASAKRLRGDSESDRFSNLEESDFSETETKNDLNLENDFPALIKKINWLANVNMNLSKTVENLSISVQKLSKRASETEKKLNDRIADLEGEIKSIKENQENNNRKNISYLNTETSKNTELSWTTVVRSNLKRRNETNINPESNSIPQYQVDQTNFVLAENQERELKKINVILHGLKPELNTEDRVQVERVFESIGANAKKIAYVRRFKQTAKDKIAPVLVQLKQDSDRRKVLSSSKNLKNKEEYKSVYIQPDLTECQRKLNKQLREKRDELNREEQDNPNGRHRWWIVKDERLFSVPYQQRQASKQQQQQ